MVSIVVVGGGLAGCAAAVAARKAGAQVTLLERMEVLGGWLRFASRLDSKYFPAREELRLMGGDDIFTVMERFITHPNVFFPGSEISTTKTLFHSFKAESALKKYLVEIGIDVRLQCRARDVEMAGNHIESVILDDKSSIRGDIFIDATAGFGPQANCQRYGNGCTMCFMRCPAFGGRVSIAAKAGVKELKGKRKDGSIGPINAAFGLFKESLAADLQAKLNRDGVVSIPVPPELLKESLKRATSATVSGEGNRSNTENVILVDMGYYVKRIGIGFTPLEELQKMPGLENVAYADPTAGTIGNAVRFMAVTPRDETFKVPDVDNLFVTSEKLGIAGVGEVIVTGAVAGHNAVRKAKEIPPLVLPTTTIIGDYIAYINDEWDEEARLRTRPHIRDGEYMARAEKAGLYTEDSKLIESRIKDNKLSNIFNQAIA